MDGYTLEWMGIWMGTHQSGRVYGWLHIKSGWVYG